MNLLRITSGFCVYACSEGIPQLMAGIIIRTYHYLRIFLYAAFYGAHGHAAMLIIQEEGILVIPIRLICADPRTVDVGEKSIFDLWRHINRIKTLFLTVYLYRGFLKVDILYIDPCKFRNTHTGSKKEGDDGSVPFPGKLVPFLSLSVKALSGIDTFKQSLCLSSSRYFTGFLLSLAGSHCTLSTGFQFPNLILCMCLERKIYAKHTGRAIIYPFLVPLTIRGICMAGAFNSLFSYAQNASLSNSLCMVKTYAIIQLSNTQAIR